MTNTRTFRAALATGLTVAATVAAGPGPAVAATAPPAPPVPTVAQVQDPSSLRCHLELPVQIRGHRFVSSHNGAAIACAGVLLGEPVSSGTLPHASGAARLLHLANKLPPAIGGMQLSLKAVGVAMPMDPARQTSVKLQLDPDPGSTHGVGHFTGNASIRRRDHRVAASVAFQPSTDSQYRRCCVTGRLIVDLTAWDV
jgi:hypothetical protein